MATLQIGGRLLRVQALYPMLNRRIQKYIIPDSAAELPEIALSEEFLLAKYSENPHLSLEACEYIWSGSQFTSLALSSGGIVLHACALAFRGSAFLLCAESGGGKSTQRMLCQELLRDRLRILNDDKPLLLPSNKGFSVFGTPWSGKSELNLNACAALKAIIFIVKSDHEEIVPLSASEAIAPLYSSCARYFSADKQSALLDRIDELLRTTSFYKFYCTESFASAGELSELMLSLSSNPSTAS